MTSTNLAVIEEKLEPLSGQPPALGRPERPFLINCIDLVQQLAFCQLMGHMEDAKNPWVTNSVREAGGDRAVYVAITLLETDPSLRDVVPRHGIDSRVLTIDYQFSINGGRASRLDKQRLRCFLSQHKSDDPQWGEEIGQTHFMFVCIRDPLKLKALKVHFQQDY